MGWEEELVTLQRKKVDLASVQAGGTANWRYQEVRTTRQVIIGLEEARKGWTACAGES